MAGLNMMGVFSMLVASGNGDKCNELKTKLHTSILAIDPETGISKTRIHKYEAKSMPEDYLRISKEIGRIISPLMESVPDHIYGAEGSVGKKRFNHSVVN